jgi:hypothetical protein
MLKVVLYIRPYQASLIFRQTILPKTNPIPINPPRNTLTNKIRDRLGADFTKGTFTGSIMEKAGVSFFTAISACSFCSARLW